MGSEMCIRDRVKDLREGIGRARRAVESGEAMEKLEGFIAATRRGAGGDGRGCAGRTPSPRGPA